MSCKAYCTNFIWWILVKLYVANFAMGEWPSLGRFHFLLPRWVGCRTRLCRHPFPYLVMKAELPKRQLQFLRGEGFQKDPKRLLNSSWFGFLIRKIVVKYFILFRSCTIFLWKSLFRLKSNEYFWHYFLQELWLLTFSLTKVRFSLKVAFL